MLKQRIITALILLPLVIYGVLELPTLYFSILLALVLLLGASEWAKLSGIAALPGRLIYIAGIAALIALAFQFMDRFDWRYYLLMVVAFWWFSVISRLWQFSGDEKAEGFNPVHALMGVIVLVPMWIALTSLHGLGEQGPRWVLFLLVLIWAADSGAYFSGRRWGKKKLAPRVSPGKTWEGVYGALVGVLILAAIAGLVLEMQTSELIGFVLLCIVTGAISIVGDLFESLMKRQRGIKDSGNLLPGHGGILDRIDSLTSAAPIFVLGMIALGIGQ